MRLLTWARGKAIDASNHIDDVAIWDVLLLVIIGMQVPERLADDARHLIETVRACKTGDRSRTIGRLPNLLHFTPCDHVTLEELPPKNLTTDPPHGSIAHSGGVKYARSR